MTKKWISFFLTAVMAFGLVACGTKNDKAKDDTAEKTQKETKFEDISGQWECVDFIISEDGSEEMNAKDLEDMIGVDMTEMYSFQAWKNGYGVLTIQALDDLDESAEPSIAWYSWTKDKDQYTLQYTTDLPAAAEELNLSGKNATDDNNTSDTDAGEESSEASTEVDEVAEALETQTMTAFFEKNQLVIHADTTTTIDGEQVPSYEEMVFKYAGENEATLMDFVPDFSDDDTRMMGNACHHNTAIILDGKYLYGRAQGSKVGYGEIKNDGGDAIIDKTKDLMNGEELESKCYQTDGDYVYCYAYNDETQKVLKISTKNQKVTTIREKETDGLQLYEGRLYFTDENFQYCSMDLDGKDLKTELEREIYYPYLLGDGWLLFQDDADGEKLHLLNLKSGFEKIMTDGRSYSPVISGDYLYYTTVTEEGDSVTRQLSRLNLNTWEKELSPYKFDGEYYIDGNAIYIGEQFHAIEDWNQDWDADPESIERELKYSDGKFRKENGQFSCWYAYGEDFAGMSDVFKVD